jgi:hypothetical protein
MADRLEKIRLYEILAHQGTCRKMVRLGRMAMSKATVRTRENGLLGGTAAVLEICVRLKQGSGLVPVLFRLILDEELGQNSVDINGSFLQNSILVFGMLT